MKHIKKRNILELMSELDTAAEETTEQLNNIDPNDIEQTEYLLECLMRANGYLHTLDLLLHTKKLRLDLYTFPAINFLYRASWRITT